MSIEGTLSLLARLHACCRDYEAATVDERAVSIQVLPVTVSLCLVLLDA
jgi:hypothetical protein